MTDTPFDVGDTPPPPAPQVWSLKAAQDALNEFDSKKKNLEKAQANYDAAVASIDKCRSVLEGAIAERDAAAQIVADTLKGA